MASTVTSVAEIASNGKYVGTKRVENRHVRLSLGTRMRIITDAMDLVESNDPREISAVLANRYRVPERTIDRILAAEVSACTRIVASMRSGLSNCMAVAKQVGAETREELLS